MEQYTGVRSLSNRSRNLSHVSPVEVSLQAALEALADPIRRRIVRELAAVPDWTRPCGTFNHLPVAKSTLSHHFTVLRNVGLLEQRDEGARRLNRLRRPEFDERFPGLLGLVVEEDYETET
ncbi:ArsR/SmtB family transcription factor [Nonomuraea typhae]|uniref:ArsR/SmtB family transcription factor n=1 Tax=Nonomuraea typhae TaxID=2603600 RepID=A0ABW7Z8V9_9ACTN